MLSVALSSERPADALVAPLRGVAVVVRDQVSADAPVPPFEAPDPVRRQRLAECLAVCLLRHPARAIAGHASCPDVLQVDALVPGPGIRVLDLPARLTRTARVR